MSDHLTYFNFSSSYQSFLTAISSIREPQFYHEAISDPKCREAMDLELAVEVINHTWDVVDLPPGVVELNL